MTPAERQQFNALMAQVEALEQQAEAVKGMAFVIKAGLQSLVVGGQMELPAGAPEFPPPPAVRNTYFGSKQRVEGSNRLVSREEVVGTAQQPVSAGPSEQP